MSRLSASKIQSNVLSDLRPLFETIPALKMFEGIAQLSLIVDANIVIGDLLWMTRKRNGQNSRTELFELLKAGTIRAFAPTFLLNEIAAKLPEQATKKKVELEVLNSIWLEYKELVSFVDVGGPDQAFLDPKDAPYIKLQRQIGVLIHSRDKDIVKMKGTVVSPAVVATLRIYSRQVVVEYSLKAGGTGCLAISFGLVKLMMKFVRMMVDGAKRVPKHFWLVGMVLLLGVLLYPPSRRYLGGKIQQLQGRAKEIGLEVFDQFANLLNEHETAKENAAAALKTVEQEIAQYPGYTGLHQQAKTGSGK